jgi:hypothetical protein
MVTLDELADRLEELQSFLQVLTERAGGGDDLDLHLALGATYRLAFGISRDLVVLDETLRRGGAFAGAEEWRAATSYPWPPSERSAEP